MRGLVICWMLIGILGFLIFPWYVTGDGFFSINWILEYSLEDYGSLLPQVFINKKYWLLPLVVPLFFPLSTLKLNQSNPIYSKIFLYSGLFGIFYFILQGFSIGIRGWNFEIFQSIFGDVENQFGVGSGAVLLCSTFIFYITHGLSSRGWLNGDNFIVGSRCRLDLIRVSPWPRIRAAVGRRPKPRASLTAVLSAQSSLRHWLSR